MTIINKGVSLGDFEAWSGAIDTQDTIIRNGKEKDFDNLIETIYPDGLSETQLNDILWFESDWLYDELGINEGDDE